MPFSRPWNVLLVVTSTSSKMVRLLARSDRVTLERRKKAILIGMNYEGDEQLSFPQRDTGKVCKLLKETFGFQDEDIIIFTDNEAEIEAGTSLPPTQRNIMEKVQEFIIPGQKNTDYVLFFSGHSGQHPTDNPEEEDGFQEFIIPMDVQTDDTGEYLPGSVIYDTDLHEHIIKPLEQTRGCHLFAIVDSCHSATMLNLRHHRCNRIGGVSSTFRRAVRHYFIEDILIPIRNTVFRKKTTQSKRCTGLCPRIPNSTKKPTVICISACKDSQLTIEHTGSATLTSTIVELLELNPQASLKDVIYAARDTVADVREAAGPAIPLAEWNPQLSSNDPLDTNTPLMYSDTHSQLLDSHGRVKRSIRDRLEYPVREVTNYISRTNSSFRRVDES